MCVVSMTGDFWKDKWDDPWKKLVPNQPISPISPPSKDPYDDFLKRLNPTPNSPTREEFENLKKEVEIMKELLKKSKEYDERNNEPNCEIEEKMDFLRKVASLVGVDLDEVFKPKE